MKCQKCEVKSPLYRNAPKGVTPANWSCIDHVSPEFRPDVSFQRTVNEIHEAGN